MPRTARSSVGGYCYHVLNRGNGRATVFHKPQDYQAFVALIAEAGLRHPTRLLAYCVMPNHFHLALWPVGDGDLSRWMHWLLTTHARRYLAHYHGTGHVWQGRFKAFPIEEDEHLRVVLRYIERNPLRASLVERAEQWPWSSLCLGGEKPLLDPGPAPRGAGWIEAVNAAMTEAECESIRTSIRRNRPLGTEAWVRRTAEKLGLESSLRAPGRPPRTTEKGGKHPRSPEL
jgi:putative transposase